MSANRKLSDKDMKYGSDNKNVSIDGDALAEFLLASGGGAGNGGSKRGEESNSLQAAIQLAKDIEKRHEIIALVPNRQNGWQLMLNFHNLQSFRKDVDEEEPTMVISFLGDTEVGKSHTIRELMDSSEERPFIQRSSDQNSSTTNNVNLYTCRTLFPSMTVNLLDFEGENGSETTAVSSTMNSSTSAANNAVSLANFSKNSSSLLSSVAMPFSMKSLTKSIDSAGSPQSLRADAVREFFPRLSYMTSDVVVMMGVEPFFSTRYLTRVLEFAKRANSGVTDVDLPVLLLISNKRDGDRCVMNIQASTEQFITACGDNFKILDQYFSALVCVYLPNKRNRTVDDDGNVFDGAELYEVQITKLKKLLAALMRARLLARYSGPTVQNSHNNINGVRNSAGAVQSASDPERIVTSKQGLWYELLPRIVRELNQGHSVQVGRLIDEAWSAAMASVTVTEEQSLDIFRSYLVHLRPSWVLNPQKRSFNDEFITRFAQFYSLTLDVSVRLLACRLRCVDPAYRLESRVTTYVRRELNQILGLLDDVWPCGCALHRASQSISSGSSGLSSANHALEGAVGVDNADLPVLCLSERRMHKKGHRGSRTVWGGGSGLGALLRMVPYSPVWVGDFEPLKYIKRRLVEDLVEEVLMLLEDDSSTFLRRLNILQMSREAIDTAIIANVLKDDNSIEKTLKTNVFSGKESSESLEDYLKRLKNELASVIFARIPPQNQQYYFDNSGSNVIYKGLEVNPLSKLTFNDAGLGSASGIAFTNDSKGIHTMPYCVGCARKFIDPTEVRAVQKIQKDSQSVLKESESFGRSEPWFGALMRALGLSRGTSVEILPSNSGVTPSSSIQKNFDFFDPLALSKHVVILPLCDPCISGIIGSN